MDLVPGARGATIWVTEDGLPTAENNALYGLFFCSFLLLSTRLIILSVQRRRCAAPNRQPGEFRSGASHWNEFAFDRIGTREYDGDGKFKLKIITHAMMLHDLMVTPLLFLVAPNVIPGLQYPQYDLQLFFNVISSN